ncbi:DUF3152 domain-containing protein [Streptomyces sp. NPDC052042]|uniref:DUF3152 domain-containing protein n=1 Tax=Streptomyces sp. NPDC052042 TaxID=3365683 RepID=UPI0037CDAB8D
MGRHSRKGPERAGPDIESARAEAGEGREDVRPGNGRRRRPTGVTAGGEGPVSFPRTGHVRGGHPEHREPGGGWGDVSTPGRPAEGERPAPGRPVGSKRTAGPAAADPARAVGRTETSGQARTVPPGAPTEGTGPLIPGPRREFVKAFDTPTALPPPPPHGPGASADRAAEGPGDAAEGGDGKENKGIKGRTFTGIAAAAVTTVLAVVVAGQVAHDEAGANSTARSAGVDRDDTRDASRSDDRPTPPTARTKPLTYEQKMAKAYPLAPRLRGSGKLDTVPGTAKAPGRGHKYRYRIDVEQDLGLDPELFARAVQETLNDDRSWAHDGAMTFERISSGDPDFVITLASPGTTADWCRKSGLDTTEDNVSCDSAATERVMINAYRWAQGSATFGPDELFAYRQMLINHEVGHRLGHNHVSCRTPGALAPVMQQQTKSLDIDGIKCRPNAWVHPGS